MGLLIDPCLESNPAAAELLESVHVKCADVKVVATPGDEPDYDSLEEIRQKFDANYDALVGVGGGSTLDVAKAVSVLVANEGPALDYRGFDLIRNSGIPVIAVPTTAGSGSEVTPNASFVDRQTKRKMGINTERYLPKLAVLDPRLTASCPVSVTVCCGMDALGHAIEGYVATGSSPMSRLFSKKAFALIFNNLRRACGEPDDLKWRSRVQLGATYAMIGMMNSGAGPASAFSYPVGVHFGVPHGLAGGVFLAEVVAVNVEAGAGVYAPLYAVIEEADKSGGSENYSARFVEQLRDLARELDVPANLGALGIAKEDCGVIREEVLKLNLDQNPVLFGEDEVDTVLERLV